MNEPESIDRRTNAAIAGSLDRHKIWESIGCPVSPQFMTEEEMDRNYRGRFSLVHETVLLEAQRVLKLIACPSCMIQKAHGEVTVTRLHILVQDDPMTTFKAMARCFCWNCAFEEYWPLNADPRVYVDDNSKFIAEEYYKQKHMQAQANPPPFGQVMGGTAAVGYRLMNRGQSALQGATQDEYNSLQRMYRNNLLGKTGK